MTVRQVTSIQMSYERQIRRVTSDFAFRRVTSDRSDELRLTSDQMSYERFRRVTFVVGACWEHKSNFSPEGTEGRSFSFHERDRLNWLKFIGFEELSVCNSETNN